MQITFRYPSIPPVDVPDGNVLGEFRPKQAPASPPAETLVQRALGAPIGGPPLRALVRPGQKVLILTDDFTRPTPVAALLPPVLAELQEAGVRQGDIKILTAPGTHRRMSDQELARKLGASVLHSYEVWQHHWREEQQLVRIGVTTGGVPIVVDRRLLDANLVVGLGHVVPHRVLGFSGGAKIVEPGVAGSASSTKEIHWLAAQVPGHDILGIADNPIRREVDQIGRHAGLRFIVNAVQGTDGKVLAVFAGDPVIAHRRGTETSRQVYGVDMPALADIVITDSYPADIDYWQAAKAVYASELAVRQGGVVIVVTPCPEGVSKEHTALLQYGVRPVAEIRRAVEQGEIQDIIGAAILALTAWVVKEHATGIMVSPGIPPDDRRKIGFTPAGTPQEALDQAFRLVGKDARVAVLKHGGEILPLVAGQAAPEYEAVARAMGEPV
ncbi:MAG TPA: nickel-dependent lactate racemase [Anaerolineae bacterium]|nr:nickel-dependent lactate racemase [Anaerolineae bacterium]HPL30166.1 nickel-dependent lactate racemase [Anaerolineae bacterium]